MRALVLYDSVFGNTEQIARAIVAALEPRAEVTLARPAQLPADPFRGLDLLVIGSPTRGFRATEALQALVNGLAPGALKGLRVAAFDTRMDPKEMKNLLGRFVVSRGGFAAPKLIQALQAKGAQPAGEPGGFIVLDSEGPLKPGELDRAAKWGAGLI
jgi:flavodoxin